MRERRKPLIVGRTEMSQRKIYTKRTGVLSAQGDRKKYSSDCLPQLLTRNTQNQNLKLYRKYKVVSITYQKTKLFEKV